MSYFPPPAAAAPSFRDTTSGPVVLPSGKTATPFSTVAVDESKVGATETLTIVLSPQNIYNPPADFGIIIDPLGGGSYNAMTHTFTETAVATGVPTAATSILQRLTYTPPTPTPGNFIAINAALSVSVSGNPTPVTDAQPVVLDIVTAPALTGTVANEPIASGSTIRPFATTRVTDNNLRYDAQDVAAIVLTDGNSTAIDGDGILTGIGLSKIGVGTYALAPSFSYNLQSNLQSLEFTPAAVAGGGTRITSFALTVQDAATTLASADTTTSVLVIGPTLNPTPPLIAGTVTGQTVASGGSAIHPFNAATISDSNPNPMVSATLTLSGGGSLNGPGLLPSGALANATYTVAATSPAMLTTTLHNLAFVGPAGTARNTSTITLTVSDGSQTATDSKTTILAQPDSGAGGNFSVSDQTTGQVIAVNGNPYSGPVPGLAQQLIYVTPDNLNIAATVPNVFIHSGSGTDALDVSRVNGNNILDGSTGSNFLVGGTGRDTFFLDDRNLKADVYSTVVNFHSGDNATVFGVTATDHVSIQDNLGAVGAKGLTYTFSAASKPNASIVIADYNTGDLTNGRLTVSFGNNADLPGQPGSGGPYLNIHGN